MVLLLVFGATFPAAAKELHVSLRYTPTTAIAEHRPVGASSAMSTPLNWVMTSEGEPAGGLIGENREHNTPVAILSTSPVTAFVFDAFSTQFRRWGGMISNSAETTLQGNLVQFQVIETNLYHTDITMRFRLFRKDTKIWEGVISGTSKKFGRSLKEENYREAISDALQELFANLVSDTAFQAAWTNAPAAAMPAAGTANGGARADMRSDVSPSEAREKLLSLQKEGFGDDAQAAWVRSVRLTPGLTAEDMIAWKRAGISQKVIEAALAR